MDLAFHITDLAFHITDLAIHITDLTYIWPFILHKFGFHIA